MTYEQQRSVYLDLISQATNEAWDMMTAAPATPIWLWYVRSTETEFGRLIVSSGTPAGARLACEARIPSSITKEALERWISSKCGRIPLYPTE